MKKLKGFKVYATALGLALSLSLSGGLSAHALAKFEKKVTETAIETTKEENNDSKEEEETQAEVEEKNIDKENSINGTKPSKSLNNEYRAEDLSVISVYNEKEDKYIYRMAIKKKDDSLGLSWSSKINNYIFAGCFSKEQLYNLKEEKKLDFNNIEQGFIVAKYEFVDDSTMLTSSYYNYYCEGENDEYISETYFFDTISDGSYFYFKYKTSSKDEIYAFKEQIKSNGDYRYNYDIEKAEKNTLIKQDLSSVFNIKGDETFTKDDLIAMQEELNNRGTKKLVKQK